MADSEPKKSNNNVLKGIALGLLSRRSVYYEPGQKPVQVTATNNVKANTANNAPAKGKKKGKYKVVKIVAIVVVTAGVATLTGLTAATLATGAGAASIITSRVRKYYNDSNDYGTYAMSELIDENNTSLDELLERDPAQLDDYEKFRELLLAKNQFIDPKYEKIRDNEGPEIKYEDLSYELISKMSDAYYESYYNMSDASAKKETERYLESYKANVEASALLNSAGKTIDSYTNNYGRELVEGIADKVLASKVIDTNNLDPDKVDNIDGKYYPSGKMKVSFDYEEDGKTKTYTSKDIKKPLLPVNYFCLWTDRFKANDLTWKMGKNINSGNYLDAINETKYLANDETIDVKLK